ncbi:imidazoleglycerol-phosphate dehydratase HisB [Bengtsoniella intestinalis]|uniref:imidazoleglycerol-phosphate dehydratase HisB n=1 Tax=Bengtsoniella intestinalis TaxID=3073143 RepID=UPI00391FBE31
MSTVELQRVTAETNIALTLNIRGNGVSSVDTGVGFLNHMLTAFAKHGDFDLWVQCNGDTHVDDHHTVEDIGIVLGQAFWQALGDKQGICRFGQWLLPMDEALIQCAVDLSGRSYLGWRVDLPTEKIGSFDCELAEEFWLGFVRNCPCSLHIRQLEGTNSHHILEGVFKGAARALKQAVSIDEKHAHEIPSTKGVL